MGGGRWAVGAVVALRQVNLFRALGEVTLTLPVRRRGREANIILSVVVCIAVCSVDMLRSRAFNFSQIDELLMLDVAGNVINSKRVAEYFKAMLSRRAFVHWYTGAGMDVLESTCFPSSSMEWRACR